MNPTQQTVSGTLGSGRTLRRLIAEGEVKLMVAAPEQVREEIRMRATEIGPVLEDILRESNVAPRWEFNE